MASKYHVRSISFPPRSHPSTVATEEELDKLQALLEYPPSTRSTFESLCAALSGLEEVYRRSDDLLSMASTCQVLARSESLVEELLDGSVRLLDICNISRDLMLQTVERVRALQSAVRRRRKGDWGVQDAVAEYAGFRKEMKRESRRSGAMLRQMDSKTNSSLPSDQSLHLLAVIRALREVDFTTSWVFQSLMSFFSSPPSRPRQSRWSLVSRLMYRGAVECGRENLNELESVDAALSKFVPVEDPIYPGTTKMTHRRLEDLAMCAEDLERSLERVFRRMIKARASLLNIISH